MTGMKEMLNPIQVHIRTHNESLHKSICKAIATKTTENDVIHISKEIYQVSISLEILNRLIGEANG